MNDNRCLDACDKGFYLVNGDKTLTVQNPLYYDHCVSCKEDCKMCDNIEECLECKKPMFLINKLC